MWYTLGTVKERGIKMIDITVMSDKELSEISEKAKEEIARRKRVEKEKDWEEVCDALRKYLDKWEEIYVINDIDSFTISRGWIDLSEFDVIRTLNY